MWWTSPLRTRLKQLIIYMGIYASLIKELGPLQRSGLNGMPASKIMIPETFISTNELVQTEKQKFISWYVTMIYHSTMTHSMSLCISFNELDKSWSRWGGGCRSRGHQAGCLRKSLFIIFIFLWKCGHFWHLSTLRTWQIIII